MKRILTMLITILVLISILGNSAMAALPEISEPNESYYLARYSASAATGNERGTIKVTFLVSATKTNLTKIGASKIVIYRASDGTPMQTIYGYPTNYLVTSGISAYTYTYTAQHLTPGTSYYAEVTVTAADANGSDSRTITTGTVKAAP